MELKKALQIAQTSLYSSFNRDKRTQNEGKKTQQKKNTTAKKTHLHAYPYTHTHTHTLV